MSLMCLARYKYLLLDPVCHIGLQDINITWDFFPIGGGGGSGDFFRL